LYTVLEEAGRTGVPLFRPLLLNYQHDTNALDLDDQFMVGSDLLVAPVLRRDMTSRMVYLPQGEWIDYWTGRRITVGMGGAMTRVEAPLEIVPMFIRAGAVIPMGPEMNYVHEKTADPITFMIYPNQKGQAETTLYEDDGVSPAYKQGVFRRTSVSVSRSGNGFQIEVGAPQGKHDPKPRSFVFVVKSMAAARQVLVDGKPLASAGANERKSGWYKDEDGVAVRISDDGKPHRIQAR
jgi:alpha-glucosidase